MTAFDEVGAFKKHMRVVHCKQYNPQNETCHEQKQGVPLEVAQISLFDHEINASESKCKTEHIEDSDLPARNYFSEAHYCVCLVLALLQLFAIYYY